MTKRDAQLLNRLVSLGFQWDDACKLRRIQMTLHRWAELECGDSNQWGSWAIERDQETEKPFWVSHPFDSNKVIRQAIPDREAGALRRLQRILKAYPEWTYYHQTDPRGCALYLIRKSELNGCNIDQVYSSRGVAVCS